MNATGTCQICGKQFKLKNGKLPRHGFSGITGGMHSIDCGGTNYEPYEETNSGIPVRIGRLQRSITQWQEWIATKDLSSDRVKDLNKDIQAAQDFTKKLQKRFDDWKQA